jgi:RNA polymerase sigma-70 factor (ECF subfamily)
MSFAAALSLSCLVQPSANGHASNGRSSHARRNSWSRRGRNGKFNGMLTTRMSLLLRVRDPDDHQSWGEFTRLYQPLLVAYVRKQGLREHDADDVVQEILISLVRALPRFELDHAKGRFRTFLWQVTNNAVIDWLRKQRRKTDKECPFDEQMAALQKAAAQEPDEAWVLEARRRVLAVALAHVREQTQEKTWTCFEEHLLKHRPAEEVARELGMTANAVYVNACRVLAKVRDKCADYQEELADG